MMNQQCEPLGCFNLPVAGSTGTYFTQGIVSATTHFVIPTAATMVLLVAETGTVRWRDDGTAPDVSNGILMAVTAAVFEYTGNLKAIQFCGSYRHRFRERSVLQSCRLKLR